MPIIRRTTSIIGKYIVDDIKEFIQDNANAMQNDINTTPDDGAEALGHAISYGIAKALASSPVKAAFAAGTCPPGGGPVGNLIFIPLEKSATEL